MNVRVRTNPRKLPRQERALQTVEAILEATARTLLRYGYEQTSTNRIAVEAGVSIGSLYQYFPSKEALVAALIDRHIEQMSGIIRATMEHGVERPLNEHVRATVRALIAAHALNPPLHRVLQEQMPRVGRLRALDDLHAEAVELVRQELEVRRERGEVRCRDAELASYFVVRTTDALLHGALERFGGNWDEETMVTEITALLCSYLTAPATP